MQISHTIRGFSEDKAAVLQWQVPPSAASSPQACSRDGPMFRCRVGCETKLRQCASETVPLRPWQQNCRSQFLVDSGLQCRLSIPRIRPHTGWECQGQIQGAHELRPSPAICPSHCHFHSVPLQPVSDWTLFRICNTWPVNKWRAWSSSP